jgi:yeast amino acid transporter
MSHLLLSERADQMTLPRSLLIMTFLLMVGANPQHHAFGFQYWKNPGAFNEYIGTGSSGRFAGIWAAVINASFTVGV